MRKEPTEWRFWPKVRIAEGCWTWRAHQNRDGYGVIKHEGKMTKAHRVAYALMVGEIPPGMQIDHICHNRACVNPSHLRICTNQENSWNSLSKRSGGMGVKGVTKHGNKWQARIGINYKIVQLGTFDTRIEALRAYAAAAVKHYGEFACSGVA
jgi:hypothetical protein